MPPMWEDGVEPFIGQRYTQDGQPHALTQH